MVSEIYFIIVGKIFNNIRKKKGPSSLSTGGVTSKDRRLPPPLRKIFEKNFNACQSLGLEVENNYFQGQDVTVGLE